MLNQCQCGNLESSQILVHELHTMLLILLFLGGINFMNDDKADTTKGLALLGGILAAITASMCCTGPLLLVLLGMGGAWVSGLTALEPFRPVSLGFAFFSCIYPGRKFTGSQLPAVHPTHYVPCRTLAAYTNPCSGYFPPWLQSRSALPISPRYFIKGNHDGKIK